jgi:hypothetical protein
MSSFGVDVVPLCSVLFNSCFWSLNLVSSAPMAVTAAILGATGKTGREVPQRFLLMQDVTLLVCSLPSTP